MIVRVRCKEGLFRYTLEAGDDAGKLVDMVVAEIPQIDPSTLAFSNTPRGGEMEVAGLRGSKLSDLGISHGHLLYATYQELTSNGVSNGSANEPAASTTAITATGSKQAARPWETVVEDEVDVQLEKLDGKIPRQRDVKMCRHGDKAMCDYCMPLEPYDAVYHADKNIKHLSFHAYLRKRDIAINKNPAATYIPPLEEESYTVKVPCPSDSHLPWPAGICTKCQPSAITLTRQPYRMVDHVEFANARLIEDLLDFWRKTAVQRFGFLLGRFEPYDVVPLGIKAVVQAIHEPPQEGETDGLTLGVPWEEQARVERLASACGLQIVGMIYSDLTADDGKTDPSKKGQVLCKRHKDSYFLSGCEMLFSAQLQSANASPSRFSMTGRFNSKFITCILTGTPEGGVDIAAYQVSEQAMAMVAADMIEASVNPNTIRLRKSEGARYVPDVFYRYTNEYKIDVKESAKPTFPVEYLIVNVTHGFPTDPKPVFLSSTFPIENRQGLHDQSLESALQSVAKVVGAREMLPIGGEGGSLKGKGRVDEEMDRRRKRLVRLLSDWHLLVFLDSCGYIEPDDVLVICKVAVTHDSHQALDELLMRPGWLNFVAIARSQFPDADDGAPPLDGEVGAVQEAPKTSSRPSAGLVPPKASKSMLPTGPSQASASPIVVEDSSDDEVGEEHGWDDAIDEDEAADFEYQEADDDDEFDDAASDVSVPAIQQASAGWRGTSEYRANPYVPRVNPSGPAFVGPTRSAPPPTAPAAAAAPLPPSMPVDEVACPHCTFINAVDASDCEVCGLPL